MITERIYQDTLTRIEQLVDGFIAAAVVDVDTGMTIAAHAVRPDFDLPAASAYSSELLKHEHRALAALETSSGVEDVLVTLTDQIHLVRPLSGTLFLYLAADRSKTNLALLKGAVRKATAGLAAAEHEAAA